MKDRPSDDGKYPVYVRVSDRGKRLHLSTGFEASEKEFLEGKDEGRFLQGRGVPKFFVFRKENGTQVKYDNKEANDVLSEIEKKINSLIDGYVENGVLWTITQLKEDFQNKTKRAYFYEFAESMIESEYRSKNAFQHARIVEDALNSFKKYDPAFEKKEFQDITPKYLQGFINYWTREGNSSSTIGIRLREIRRIYNVDIRDGVISQDYYPFSRSSGDSGVKIPRTEINKADKYLTKESLKALLKGKLKKKVHNKTRHLFLFSLFSRGMNWKDMALLTNDSFYKTTVTDETTKETKEVTMMRYQRSKTKREFDIEVSEEIRYELKWFKENTKLYGKHVLPIILEKVEPEKLDVYLQQSRKKFNRHLKDVAKELKFPESQQDISIYTARHSFAMYLQNKGIAIEYISEALGHQSIKTTRHYLDKFSTTKMAEVTSINLLDD